MAARGSNASTSQRGARWLESAVQDIARALTAVGRRKAQYIAPLLAGHFSSTLILRYGCGRPYRGPGSGQTEFNGQSPREGSFPKPTGLP